MYKDELRPLADRKMVGEDQRKEFSGERCFATNENPMVWENQLSNDTSVLSEKNGTVSQANGSALVQASQPMLKLQRQYGNRYVQRVVDLMRKRDGDSKDTPEMEDTIQRKRGDGQPLENGPRTQMESAFGADFSHALVHTDSKADLLKPSTDRCDTGLYEKRLGHNFNQVRVQPEFNSGGPNLGGSPMINEVILKGFQGNARPLPYRELIQRSFGKHSISDVHAFIGGNAKPANEVLDATAYTVNNNVAFRETPDLFTAAHEAAHVLQQRTDLKLNNDEKTIAKYERHADAVASAVVQGRTAEKIIDEVSEGNNQKQLTHAQYLQFKSTKSKEEASKRETSEKEMEQILQQIIKGGHLSKLDKAEVNWRRIAGGQMQNVTSYAAGKTSSVLEESLPKTSALISKLCNLWTIRHVVTIVFNLLQIGEDKRKTALQMMFLDTEDTIDTYYALNEIFKKEQKKGELHPIPGLTMNSFYELFVNDRGKAIYYAEMVGSYVWDKQWGMTTSRAVGNRYRDKLARVFDIFKEGSELASDIYSYFNPFWRVIDSRIKDLEMINKLIR